MRVFIYEKLKEGGKIMSNKKPLVRYFYDGEWKDATVKDIGDLEKLTTSVKTDIVSAINSLSNGSGMTEEVKKAVEDLQSNVNNLETSIDNIKTGGLNQTQKNELQVEMAKKVEEINTKINAINEEVDAEINKIKIEYNSKMEEIAKELEESQDTIDKTKSDLESVRKDLSNTDLNVLNVEKEVDNVKGEIKQKVDQTVFDLTEAEVERHKTSIEQNAKGIELSATKEELSLATDRVSKAEAKIEIHDEKINSKVSSEEMRKEIEKIDKYQPNLLRNTRDWIDWYNVDKTKLKVKSDTYQMCHILEVSGNDIGLEIAVFDLEVGKTYTLTVWAKAKTGSELWFDNGKMNQMAQFDGDKTLSESWKRFKVSVVADSETMDIKFVFKKLSGTGELSGSKMEVGASASGWQPHADDIYERTVKNETQIQQNADSIVSTVKTLETQGDTLKKHETKIDQQDKSIKLQVDSLEKIEDQTTKNTSSIAVMEKEITSKVSSTEVGELIADVNIDNRNRILNSDFVRSTEKWTTAKEFKVKEINGSNMLHAERSGLTSDLSITATSNSFPVTQGQRIMFGFDFMADKAKYPDNEVVAIYEVLNAKDVRVDFKEISLKGRYVNNGTVQRINDSHISKLADAAKARIVFVLRRNGSVSFGKAMAQSGDIKSTDWSLAPEDVDIRRIQMETQIKQTQKEIELKVSSAEMDALTERVNTNSSKIDMNDKKIDLKVTETRQYTDNKTKESETSSKNYSDTKSKEAEKNSKTYADTKSKEAETNSKTYADAQIKIETDKISQTVTSVKQTAEQAKKDATDKAKETRDWAQSQINQTSKTITSKVEEVSAKVDSFSFSENNLLSKNMISANTTKWSKDLYLENGSVSVKGEGAYQGVYFEIGNLKNNTEYVMRYKFKKKSGKLTSIGGHLDSGSVISNGIIFDRTKYPNVAWASGMDVKDDVEEHEVIVFLKTLKIQEKTHKVYIQPNRKHYDNYAQSEINITEWSLVEGNVPSKNWTPSFIDVNERMDNIQIGGRNYYKTTTNIAPKTNASVVQKNTADTPNGFRFNGNEKTPRGVRMHNVIDGNGFWTVSGYLRGTQGVNLTLTIDICDNGNVNIAAPTSNEWIYFTVTAEVKNYSKDVFHFVDFDNLLWAHYLFKDIKVEKGMKATDWTPAPEDQSKEVADLKTWTTTEIKQTSNSWGVKIDSLQRYTNALKDGKSLYGDPMFLEGFNGLSIYNNAGNGNVTYSIVERPDNPTETPRVVEVVTKGAAAPNHGGITWQNKARANAVYIYRLVAKIPSGRTLTFASNATGDGNKQTWLTPTAGTGKWEEYLFMLACGSTGSFSTTGFFYLQGGAVPTAAAPLKWEICLASATDITSYDTTLQDLKKEVEFMLTPDEIYGMVSSSEGFKNSIDELATKEQLDEATDKLPAVASDLETVKGRVGKFEQTSESFGVSLGTLNGRVDENEKKLMDVDHFMTFKRDDKNPDNAFLKIGSGVDKLEIVVSRDRISFNDGGEEIAYFSNQELFIKRGIMTDSLRVGSHMFENRGNGSTVLTFNMG